MTSPLLALAERLAVVQTGELSSVEEARLDAAIRATVVAIGIGATAKRGVAPIPPENAYEPISQSSGLFPAMTSLFLEGLLGAATDLDALDGGPAHCALPAVSAAAAATAATGGTSVDLAAAALAGIEAGSRLRAAVQGRPGSGFHSVGVFGTFAAAAASARAFGLGPEAFANSLGIALSRAAGLAQNSAATDLGLTHFGWAAAHGFESGWLASRGMTASLDVAAALGAYYPTSIVATEGFADTPLEALSRLYFKHFPCNIYLNLVVLALDDGTAADADAFIVELPPVHHLDAPAARTVRAARNSVQMVVAGAANGAATYRTFAAPEFDPRVNAALGRRAAGVSVHMPETVATALDRMTVRIRALRNGGELADRSLPGSVLEPWGRTHAHRLTVGLGLDSWIDAVYDADYRQAHRLAVTRLLSKEAVEV